MYFVRPDKDHSKILVRFDKFDRYFLRLDKNIRL